MNPIEPLSIWKCTSLTFVAWIDSNGFKPFIVRYDEEVTVLSQYLYFEDLVAYKIRLNIGREAVILADQLFDQFEPTGRYI